MTGVEAKGYGSLVEAESLALLKSYLDAPEEWYLHNYRYPASIMHRIATSQPLQKSAAELNELQDVTSAFLTSINSSFVEFFPSSA